MLPILETTATTWSPGIGDPTPLGWVTVAAYALAALLCVGAWRGAAPESAARGSSARRAWFVLTLAMLFLGLNKQLDLQTLVTDVGRHAARAQGWYNQRRPIQFLFVLTIFGFACAVALWIVFSMRNQRAPLRLAAAGAVLLAGFIVIRAASFHHVDRLLGKDWKGLKINAVFELGGIGLVALGALWQTVSAIPAASRQKA